jgi:hypothetical protein
VPSKVCIPGPFGDQLITVTKQLMAPFSAEIKGYFTCRKPARFEDESQFFYERESD